MIYKNAFLLHFCVVDKNLLTSLATLGINTSWISIPSFAISKETIPEIKAVSSHIGVFDIAGWLSSNAQDPTEHYYCKDSGLIRSSLYYQSLRLGNLKDLGDYERYLFIDKIIDKAYSFLKSNKIDFICFGGIPHSVVDTAINFVGAELRIPIIILQDKPIAPLRCFVYDHQLSTVRIKGGWKDEQELKEKANEIMTYYKENGTYFIQRNNRESPYMEVYKKTKPKNKETILDRLEGSKEEEGNKYEYWKKAIEYYRFWCSHSLQVDEEVKLNRGVVYYMHIEPESTVNPSAGMNHPFQITLIKDLRNRLDSKVPLLIREHPLMFTEKYKEGEGFDSGRPEGLIQAIKALPNTHLLHPETNSSELITRALAGATLSGSIIYDYMINGKVVLIDSSCQNVHDDNTIEWREYDFIDKKILDTWEKMLKKQTQEEIMMKWISNSIPGTPNAHLNTFMGVNNSSDIKRNSIQLAKSIKLALENMMD